jgi:hypothetical protein
MAQRRHHAVTLLAAVAAGLEDLLSLLNRDATQRAWRPAAGVHQVLIWRTADSDNTGNATA